jgi:uncharacterized protein (DUF1697 family)
VTWFRSIYSQGVRYVAFLRGINLGKRRPPMTQLRTLFEEIGFTEVETFIASGNVIFTDQNANPSALEPRIEAHLEASLGYDVATFVRSAAHVRAIAESRVFAEDGQTGVTIQVSFLKQRLSPALARKLEVFETNYDQFRVKSGEFYWLCRGPMSESKVWTLPEIKALKLPSGTMRNITSIRKLVARHIPSAD